MSLILAIDSNQRESEVALYDGQARLAEISTGNQPGAEALIPSIIKCLSEASKELDQVDLVATLLGPGSFTGIRNAIATVQGLCFQGGLQALGAPCLEVAIYDSEISDKVLLAKMLANAREFVFGAYRLETTNEATTIVEVAAPRTIAQEDYEPYCAGEYGQEAITIEVDQLSLINASRLAGFSLKVLQGELRSDRVVRVSDELSPCYVMRPQAATLSDRGIELRSS